MVGVAVVLGGLVVIWAIWANMLFSKQAHACCIVGAVHHVLLRSGKEIVVKKRMKN